MAAFGQAIRLSEPLVFAFTNPTRSSESLLADGVDHRGGPRH